MLNKLDAPRIMVLTIMACAVMVAKRTTMRAQFTFSTLEVYHA